MSTNPLINGVKDGLIHPGKTLVVYDSKVGSSEIVSVEVEDKIN